MSSRPFSRSATDISARRTYELLDEPSGAAYRSLIEAALAECSTGVLTVGGGSMAQVGRELVESLWPHLAAAPVTGPGGQLVRFRLVSESAALLTAAADRLFAWRRPQLPDNLCLFRSDGSPWMVTIAAEGLGYIEMTALERVRLAHTAPQVASVLAHQAARDAILATFERRLEERLDPLVEELLIHARTVIGDNRDGLTDALQEWVLSGDDLRVAAALEMIASLRLEDLRVEVEELRSRIDGPAAGPVTFNDNPVLRERWRERRRRLLDGVLVQLGGERSLGPG